MQFGVSRRRESQRSDRQRSPIRPRSITTWSRPAWVSRRLVARPAWPAPMTTVSTADMTVLSFGGSASAGHDVDDDGRGLGQGVVHGGPAARLLDDAAQ